MLLLLHATMVATFTVQLLCSLTRVFLAHGMAHSAAEHLSLALSLSGSEADLPAAESETRRGAGRVWSSATRQQHRACGCPSAAPWTTC